MEGLDFRVIMQDMQALIKKEISPSSGMRKYYGGEILFYGFLQYCRNYWKSTVEQIHFVLCI